VIVINAGWGLGENIVQDAINPDEYRVFTPLLDEAPWPIIEKNLGDKVKKMVYTSGGSKTTKNVETSQRERRAFVLEDDEILQLGRWAKAIEEHYEKPMDIEWAKDGELDELFILQARPETVQSQKEAATLHTYSLQEKGERLVTGLAIGQGIAAAEACVIEDVDEIDRFREGSILITGMTDPDWVPIMKQASGIVTDHGGRTSHAAIVSRELGIPAIVRLSDFKTNEYADLIGGQHFEPEEANPMLGWRGASRYYDDKYRDGFALECQALRCVREEIGLDNVVVMIPFCRTPAEADRVLDVMAEVEAE
jgi:pyruvate,water dikinase